MIPKVGGMKDKENLTPLDTQSVSTNTNAGNAPLMGNRRNGTIVSVSYVLVKSREMLPLLLRKMPSFFENL